VLPDYITYLMNSRYLLHFVIALFIFLIALIFNQKWAHMLRVLVGLILIIGGTAAFFIFRNYELASLCACALLIMILYRIIANAILTGIQAWSDHQFEQQALKRAESRRGNRAMRSDAAVVEGAQTAAEFRQPSGAPATEQEQPEDKPLSRAELLDAVKKLQDLNAAGVLTDDELNQKKGELYEKLG
jgi:thiol:disulfide interchange protein